jgi:hypothetical protein
MLMDPRSTPKTPHFKNSFSFESYGVPIRVESDMPDLLEDARTAAEKAVVGNFRLLEKNAVCPHVYGMSIDRDGIHIMYKDGVEFRNQSDRRWFLKYFDSALRVTVAEYAVDRVFLHAGAVSWRGKGILIPGNSFAGKTSLVAELVRNGATYYSDEYAVFDSEGRLHPFARKLAIRSRPPKGEVIQTTYISPDELGGQAGTEPIPIAAILLTEFKENAVWKPEVLTPGQAVIKMISQTIPIRYDPELSLKVLKNVTEHAIIVQSLRNDATDFAKLFLDFIDNKAV